MVRRMIHPTIPAFHISVILPSCRCYQLAQCLTFYGKRVWDSSLQFNYLLHIISNYWEIHFPSYKRQGAFFATTPPLSCFHLKGISREPLMRVMVVVLEAHRLPRQEKMTFNVNVLPSWQNIGKYRHYQRIFARDEP